jgi:hypothetical protein
MSNPLAGKHTEAGCMLQLIYSLNPHTRSMIKLAAVLIACTQRIRDTHPPWVLWAACVP